jgi:arylsulfatase A-like enzyme
VDDVSTDFLIEFLKNRKPDDKPFDAVFGFKSPHDPRTPAERGKDRFAGEKPRPVPNLDIHPPFLPVKTTKPHRNEDDKRPPREGLLDHFRCVSCADDCIGRILQTLDDLKLADNTIVIFTSDNGYYFGEHQVGDKRSAYEESMRIPMLIRYPNHIPAGKALDQMALNIDVAPTLLEYAGVKVPETMRGRSWKPLLEGNAKDWRTAFFYEYFYENGFAMPTTTAARTETAKIIKYLGHPEWTELFDLKADPYETHNLAQDDTSKPLLEQMQSEYEKQAKAVEFQIPPYADQPKPDGKDHF